MDLSVLLRQDFKRSRELENWCFRKYMGDFFKLLWKLSGQIQTLNRVETI